MGTWSVAIKDSDAFADVYNDFFELYNKGEQTDSISKTIVAANWEILEIEEEKHSLWFAVALAQWETKSLSKDVLSKVENIITSGADLKLWLDLGASEQNIKKRRIALDKFLEKIKSERPKAKPRKRPKVKTPVFSTGDCLIFKLRNGNYGGAIVLASDTNIKTGYNLVATTRLNQESRPSIKDFENAEVLICNFGEWQDRPNVVWYMPDLYYKNYSGIYENIGEIAIEIEYDPNNYKGEGYLFKPTYTSGWFMNNTVERQFESEILKPKPLYNLMVAQLIK